MVKICNKQRETREMSLVEYIEYLSSYWRIRIVPIHATVDGTFYDFVVETYKDDQKGVPVQWHRAAATQEEFAEINRHVILKPRKAHKRVINYAIVTKEPARSPEAMKAIIDEIKAKKARETEETIRKANADPERTFAEMTL